MTTFDIRLFDTIKICRAGVLLSLGDTHFDEASAQGQSTPRNDLIAEALLLMV